MSHAKGFVKPLAVFRYFNLCFRGATNGGTKTLRTSESLVEIRKVCVCVCMYVHTSGVGRSAAISVGVL